jgi:asparagine N-glycosylation enzyme membrane subunit Stt3
METDDINHGEKEVAPQHHVAQAHSHARANGEEDEGFLLRNKWVVIALALIIIVLAIWLRTGLLQYQGLFEPDGFFYYTALKQAVVQGFFSVNTHMKVDLSGFPVPNGLNEAPGVLYATLIPYYILQYFGISLLTVMRLVPILFGVLDALAAYLLVQYLFKSRGLGLLAMFFVAASSGNIARSAGAVYRGDSFISFFVMIALWLMLMVLNEPDQKKRYIYTALTALVVSIGNVVWNGGVIVPALYFVSVIAIAMYGFVAADEKALKNCTLLLGAMLAAYVLNQIYIYALLANPSILSTPSFFLLFVPVLIGTFAAHYIISKRHKMQGSFIANWTSNIQKRLGVLILVTLILTVLIYSIAGSYISSLFTNGNSIYVFLSGVSTNVANTTQELQPPTWSFIWASFGLQVFLAPLGVLLFIFFAHIHGNKSYVRKGKLTVNINYGFIALFIYLVVAAYLQNGAIRYNAILSIPIAIFSAYALYITAKIIAPYSIVLKGTKIKFIYILAGLIFALLLIQITLVEAQSFSSYQADGINPDFLAAMTWMSNNTATNATVLDLWPDGSVVEAWANRASWQDSVGGENGTRIVQFGSFLFNTTTDSQFLINKADRPNYIVVRNFWFAELGGIAVEANLTGNLTQYGYDAMTSFNSGGNSTEQVYQFSSADYITQMVVEPQANGTRKIIGLLGPQGQTNLVPLKNVILFNTTNQNYTVITSNDSQALNFTLLISFVGNNITNAALIGSELPQTNMFKLLIECGYTQCAYAQGDGNVTAQLVYANPDTKIIKFIYH